MYRVYPEKKVGQFSELKLQSLFLENEYKDYCLNGERYYLVG